jgi:hypothetical protein
MKLGGAACILIAVCVGACNTGLVSIGDDAAALECQPEDCAELPSESPVCSDMTMGIYECERDMADGCAWVLSCPALSCPASACGAPPAPSPMCLNDTWGWGYACDRDGMQCVWQGVCPEAARECPHSECEAASFVVAECMDGPTEGVSCLTDATGNCRWTAVVCSSP